MTPIFPPSLKMRRVIGLMSGTSLDGVDAAFVKTNGETIDAMGPAITLPYEPSFREKLRRLLDRVPTLAPDDAELRAIARQLTERHAEAVAALGKRAELVGFPGQTIRHQPRRRRTWQIGDGLLLARLSGLPVAWDFRSADVAAGGEGAPLAPLFHAALAAALPKPLIVLNLGGVANATWIGSDSALAACDTGPGNALLDDFVRARTGAPYDTDGALALTGRADEAVLATLLADPYFARQGPKSLDRLAFAYAHELLAGLSAADGAATLTEFSAAAVAAARFPATPRQVLLTGGGRRNPALARAIARRLGVPVAPVEAVGWDGDALEAQCFGFLAVRIQRGLPLSLPATTGVPRPMPGGRLAWPDG